MQAFSTLALEACLVARTMGYKVVFTDHSLFGFADAASIVMNKVGDAAQGTMSIIAVPSHLPMMALPMHVCMCM